MPGSMHAPTVAEDEGKTHSGVFVGCSRAAAGMEGDTDWADPADPNPRPWEAEMEM